MNVLLGRIDLKQQDNSVFFEVIEDNQYKIFENDLSGKNVLDIGANNGMFTLLANSYNAKKIVSVEANKNTFELLQKNTMNLNNVTIMNKAIFGTSNQKVKIGTQPEFSPHDGRCYTVPDSNGDVSTISFHDVLANFESNEQIILKMDCEGAEYDALYGASISDLRRCSTILIEMHENIFSTLGQTGLMGGLRRYLWDLGFTEKWCNDYIDDRVKILRFDLERELDKEVTVIISEFIRPELLQDQIDCFLSQSFPPKEIIVWQTHVKEYEKLYEITKQYENVHIVKTEHDFNLPARFAITQLAKTPYVLLTDDDQFPAPEWLETCYKVSKRYNSVVSPYGVLYDKNQNDLKSIKYGEGDVHNEEPVAVDMGGHAWFGKKEWFAVFWKEPVLDEKIADDIHFAYTLKKYSDVGIVVSPYKELDKSAWGNLKPEVSKGYRALHTRKQEDTQIWKNAEWNGEDNGYFLNNLKEFCTKREVIVQKYLSMSKELVKGTIGTIIKKEIKCTEPVTCVVSTKNRYFSTLPACLVGIANQTYKPKEIIIIDDGEFKNLFQSEPIYQTIFDYFLLQGIMWYHLPGLKSGQVANHIKSLSHAKTNWIWRIDDDEVPEVDVLEKLVRHIGPNVGAIGGLVLPKGSPNQLPKIVSNNIADIYTGLNEQWFIHPNNTQPKEVDHLYSSFIYRKDIANYNTDLSPVGHREETMLTYDMKSKGYSIILEPSAKTWHFRNPQGGIRTYQDVNLFANDERVFSQKLAEWNVKPNEYAYTVLDCGIGDHYAFKYWLPQFFEKNKGKKCVLFVCFPQVFEGVQNIQLASIADAKTMFGTIDKYNVYLWMESNKWDKNLCWAYKKLYNLSGGELKATDNFVNGTGNTIIISPFSFTSTHAKTYPYWNELIPLLKTLNYKLIQIGRTGEEKLLVDEHWFDFPLIELEKRMTECRCFISGDSFLQHMNNCLENSIKGIVIWGESNPKIFGYPYNLNILKAEKYLRLDQFGVWHGRKRNDDAFDTSEILFEKIKQFLQK